MNISLKQTPAEALEVLKRLGPRGFRRSQNARRLQQQRRAIIQERRKARGLKPYTEK